MVYPNSPLGKVPLLKVEDKVLFESAVICEYWMKLHPVHCIQPTHWKKPIISLVEFGSSILNDIAGFYSAADADGFEQKRRSLIDKFVWLEAILAAVPILPENAFR